MKTVRLYRFRDNEVDVLLMPVCQGNDVFNQPTGGFTMARIQKVADERGFRFKRQLAPSEWKRIQRMRASGAVRERTPPNHEEVEQ